METPTTATIDDTAIPASIIVADDDPATLLMYKRILQDRYEVRTCTNGAEVLSEFTLKPADLVILDNQMPEMDGRETTEALRRSSASWNVPIIIVSAQDSEENILDGLSYGANDYIVKPLKAAELLAKITVALRKRESGTPDAGLGPGSVFDGKYQIDRVLGEGGYSQVFAARNIKAEDSPWVALKIFDLPSLKQRSFGMKHFLREAYQHSRLNHPNIVKLFDFGQVDTFYFLAMEYLEGVILTDRLHEDGQLPEAELFRIAREVGKALACINSHNLIHRDVKPANIMLCHNGEIKLLDFGLAKNPSEDTISIEEVFRGTPHFTSPEHILHAKDIDIRSDLYSLGATLYFAATGVYPFDADSPVGVLRQHLHADPKPIRDLRPELNKGLAKLIHQCLKRNRDDRPTVAEFQAVCDSLTPA